MLVLVKFPESLPEYSNNLFLFDVDKIIRKPIKVDYALDTIEKSRHARVCVEISLKKPLVPNICIENVWQNVEYENLDLLCL